MATTTVDAFNQFNNKISASSDMMTRVRSRRDTVLGYLRNAFTDTSTMRFESGRLIGSFGRGTAARPFDDIDILAHLYVDANLWATRYQSNSSDFLYRVRRALNDGTSIHKVGARGQAVRLFYSDGLSVDVAAVVKYTTGGYGIPDGSGGWLTTDPIRHAAYLDERNAKVTGDLKKITRFVKKWNAAHSSRLSSFHIEAMVARTFVSLGTDSRKALEVFFNYNASRLSVNDPAGYSGDLSRYLTVAARQAVTDSMVAARDRAILANAAEVGGNYREAIRLWRIVLGDDFPSYG